MTDISASGPAKPSVLVVDDEPRNVLLLHALLESRGYTVWTASDGEQGLTLAREQSPDVVLLDVMMPRLNGFDVCRRLKAEPETAMIPVLLVTSLDAREDRLQGIGAGANDFITKPIDSGELLLRVKNAVTTKQLHDEVTRQLQRLQELEAARDTLTHMVVHDLRSPLTGLLGYLDLLRRSAAAGAADDILEYAQDATAVAWKLRELVSQVLDVSRLESGQMPVSPVETDLVPLLPSVVALLGPPPPGVNVVYDVAQKPFMATCDRDLMGRVLANLVGNAFKFTPEGGEVRVGLEATNGQTRITITDTGPGIAAEHRQMIFEKFGQAPQSQTAGRRSAGLGLTFCKLAVEAHGGRIGVESPSGGGTQFWIEFPRTPQSV